MQPIPPDSAPLPASTAFLPLRRPAHFSIDAPPPARPRPAAAAEPVGPAARSPPRRRPVARARRLPSVCCCRWRRLRAAAVFVDRGNSCADRFTRCPAPSSRLWPALLLPPTTTHCFFPFSLLRRLRRRLLLLLLLLRTLPPPAHGANCSPTIQLGCARLGPSPILLCRLCTSAAQHDLALLAPQGGRAQHARASRLHRKGRKAHIGLPRHPSLCQQRPDRPQHGCRDPPMDQWEA